MGIFDKEKSISRKDLKDILRKDRGMIPGGGGRRYTISEKSRMEREVFGPQYGSNISKDDFRRAVQGLELGKLSAKSDSEKKEIEKKIKYLKKLGGKPF